MRHRGDPESREQARVIKLYRLCGCTVYPTSQYRASRQAVGMPDLYVTHPAHADWWHEVKAPGGKVSDAQRSFDEHASAIVVVGGYDEAVVHLEWLGVIVPQSTKRSA